LFLGLLSACAGSNDRGQALYSEGRFIEAAEVFEHSEPRVSQLEPRERVLFGLYRGLTFLQLGDYENATRWLNCAETGDRVLLGSLSAVDRERLRLAQARLAQLRPARESPLALPRADAFAPSDIGGSRGAYASAPSTTAAAGTQNEQERVVPARANP
jgi:hypothetical protein